MTTETLETIKRNTYNVQAGREFNMKTVKGIVAKDKDWLRGFIEDLQHDINLDKGENYPEIAQLNKRYNRVIGDISKFLNP